MFPPFKVTVIIIIRLRYIPYAHIKCKVSLLSRKQVHTYILNCIYYSKTLYTSHIYERCGLNKI